MFNLERPTQSTHFAYNQRVHFREYYRDEATAEGNSPSRNRDVRIELPVSEGEMREVEIESLGDKGDGITKIDGGYVVIVPDTEVGERVTIRLDDVRENVGFAEVVKRQHDPMQDR